VSERELALFNLGDRFAAIDNACPHRQGPLADGIVAGTAVFCPLHAWKICLETGIPLAGGEGHVNSHQTKLVGRKIYVALAGTTHDATQGVR
jgi:nitrite reductase (NADH) small subunit